MGGRCPEAHTPTTTTSREGNPAPAAPARPAQARSAAAARGAERHSAARGPDAQVALTQCRRRPRVHLRRGVPVALLAPETDHISSAWTPSSALPSSGAHATPCSRRRTPKPLPGDHHGGDQQRMQHQGALPISASEPGRDSAGGQVHPHFPRGRQRHYWGECFIRRKLEEGSGSKHLFTSETQPLRLSFCSGSGLLILHPLPPQPLLSPASGWLGVACLGLQPSLCRVRGGAFPVTRSPKLSLLLSCNVPTP